MEVFTELVGSVTEILNDTDFYTVKTDDETYSIDPMSITLGSDIMCKEGSVRLEAVCGRH